MMGGCWAFANVGDRRSEGKTSDVPSLTADEPPPLASIGGRAKDEARIAIGDRLTYDRADTGAAPPPVIGVKFPVHDGEHPDLRGRPKSPLVEEAAATRMRADGH